MTESTLSRSSSDSARLTLGDLGGLLGFHLRLANVAMYRDFVEAMSELELTQSQHAVLQLVGVNHGVAQTDLAATLGADRATMMALVDRLEDRGLVRRQRSQSDRRRQELSLTARGEEVLQKARLVTAAHEAHFTARFTPAELEQLIAALSRIHRQV